MATKEVVDVTEQKRLNDARDTGIPWKKWGPYLSERQWGTVREDYSQDGNAWDYFSHDQARSRAYRWGEDGLGGISDDKQHLCFALALWNERDAILKERLFGLTNGEGNHGEDVKEYYFYIDSTPTHSYMKYLYKYPQREFPYRDLVETNRRRSREELEYELMDTRFSMTTAISTCSSSMPRKVRKICSSESPFIIAARNQPGFACYRRCGSGIHGPGAKTREAVDTRKKSRRNSGHHMRTWANTGFTATGTQRYCSPKTRRIAASLGRGEWFGLSKGCLSHLRCLRRQRGGESGSEGTKAAAHYRIGSPRRWEQEVRLRLDRPATTIHSAALMPVLKSGLRRRTNSISGSLPPH